MKLYKVKLRGLKYSAGTNYGESYVVANNPSEAYDKVRAFVLEKNLGFASDREMESVELLAETGDYPDCKTILFM